MPRDVHLVPFFVVALLVIVYILLIGPGDYFLLRRLGRGMQWTWITFPTIVVALCRRGLPGRLLAERRPASRQPGRPGRYRRRGHGPRRQLVQHLQSAGRIVRPLHAAPPARRPTAAGDQRVAGLVRQGGQSNSTACIAATRRTRRRSGARATRSPGRRMRWTRSAACRSRSGLPRVLRSAGWDGPRPGAGRIAQG